ASGMKAQSLRFAQPSQRRFQPRPDSAVTRFSKVDADCGTFALDSHSGEARFGQRGNGLGGPREVHRKCLRDGAQPGAPTYAFLESVVTDQPDRRQRHPFRQLVGIPATDQHQLGNPTRQCGKQPERDAIRPSKRGVGNDGGQGPVEVEAEDQLGERDPL
ncbi:MAG TPA: hypothetical protein VLS53_07405, partial [Candidatus Dormibacteraeota bacterium]|nr:hypothetical protein [Candidatus Dormibacteraeota bacterium]